MSVVYAKTSPYYSTPTWGQFLDMWTGITIPSSVNDAVYQIDLAYNHRPDLLAYDLYRDTNFWWVFAVRNPDIIKDPIYDFSTGTIIYVPNMNSVQTAIGL
jgi:hypothetical protein